jgi:hypothetical protein
VTRLRGVAALAPGVLVLVSAFVAAAPASAQSRIEIGAGLTWTGGFDAGGSAAQLTRNPATGSLPLTLFDMHARVLAAAGASATIGVGITSRVAVEVTADYSRPVLRSTITSDFEAATGTTAESRLTSLVVGGSGRYRFASTRLAPFAYGGAGWSRQLDQDNVMLVTGLELHGGAGVIYGLDRHFALRGQGGVTIREKAIAFEERRRIQPQASGGITYRW